MRARMLRAEEQSGPACEVNEARCGQRSLPRRCKLVQQLQLQQGRVYARRALRAHRRQALHHARARGAQRPGKRLAVATCQRLRIEEISY